MQVAISTVLPDVLDCHFERFSEHHYQRPALSQSPQCEEKTHFEPSSPSPPSVHAIDAKSNNFGHFAFTISFPEAKGNQITEIQEKCCPTRPRTRKMLKNRSQKRGGLKRDSPLKFIFLLAREDLTLGLPLSV